VATPSLFILACSVCKSLQCLNFCPDMRGQRWPLILAHLFNCAVEREEDCKQILLACVGNARIGWTTLGLPQPKAGCTFRVHSAQAPGYSVRVLSQVDPVFCALPKSKPLRFLGAPQGHRPRWAVCLVLIPGPSCSGDQCLASPLSQVGHASYPPP